MKPAYPLMASEFEGFEALDEDATGDEIYAALETLLPRLTDELVEVESANLFEPSSSRLSVFQHSDQPKITCFALVSGKGEVLIGRTDDLGETSRMRLGDFNPIYDEVLSVAVTGQLSLMGDHLDLFIITRSLRLPEQDEAPPEPRAFHGLIRFKQDRPV